MHDLATYPARTSTVQVPSQAQSVTAQCWWQYHIRLVKLLHKSASEEKHLKILSSEMVAEINSALMSVGSWFKNQANKFKQMQWHVTVTHNVLKTSIMTS